MSIFEIPPAVEQALPPGAHDFDFLEGDWIVTHRRLRKRLVGSTDWEAFETPSRLMRILGGLGNIDQCRVDSPEFFEGASLRLFDMRDGLWRIYWMDTRGARLFPPVIGKFDGARGVFCGDDVQDGVPVKVEFVWDRGDPQRPTWHQSFSANDGRTWEANWHMQFRRTGCAILAPMSPQKNSPRLHRPANDEYNSYYQTYTRELPHDGDIVATLRDQHAGLHSLLANVSDAKAAARPAPGEWSIKEVIGHMLDTERLFAFRAMWFARGESAALPGMEPNPWVENATFNARPLSALLEEFRHLRAATVHFFEGLDDAAWLRSGTASGNPVTVRALAWITAGHELHHLASLRDKYVN